MYTKVMRGFIVCGVLLAGSGCAKTVSGSSPTCAALNIDSVYGNLNAQQAGPGTNVQWGIQPKVDFTNIHVVIKVDGRKVDEKNQAYAPHGSINSIYLKTGAQVYIYGGASDPKGNTLAFEGYCKSL